MGGILPGFPGSSLVSSKAEDFLKVVGQNWSTGEGMESGVVGLG